MEIAPMRSFQLGAALSRSLATLPPQPLWVLEWPISGQLVEKPGHSRLRLRIRRPTTLLSFYSQSLGHTIQHHLKAEATPLTRARRQTQPHSTRLAGVPKIRFGLLLVV